MIAEPAARIDPEGVRRIRSVPYFQASQYGDLDVDGTLGFFVRRYVRPLSNLLDISSTTVVDCSAGLGWFSIAYVLAGGESAIAVDLDHDRLAAAKSIAEILSVAERIEFIGASIQHTPLAEDSVDVFVSVETLEHVGRRNIDAALRRIRDIACKGVIITTPNKIFPVVAHDTRLPFIHWLSPSRRKTYARLFGRREMDQGNEFVSPFDLRILLEKFEPASSCLTFPDFESYMEHFPYYLPYGPEHHNRLRVQPSIAKAAYYWIVSKALGRHSYWLFPSLSRIFVVKQQ